MEVGLGVSLDIPLVCNRTYTNNFWRPFKCFLRAIFCYAAGLKAVGAGGRLL